MNGEKKLGLSELLKKNSMEMAIRKSGKEMAERYQNLKEQIEERKRQLQDENLVGTDRENVEFTLEKLEEEKRGVEDSGMSEVEMTENEKQYEAIKMQIETAKRNLENKKDEAVRAAIVRGIASLEKEMVRLEVEIENEKIKTEETLEESKLQASKELSNAPEMEEQAVEEMTELEEIEQKIEDAERKLANEKDDKTRMLIQRGIKLYQEEKESLIAEMEEEKKTTEISKKSKVQVTSILKEEEKSEGEMSAVEKLEKKIKDGEKRLETVTDEESRQWILRGIELYKEEIAKMKTRYQELERQIEEGRKNLVARSDEGVKKELMRAIQKLEQEKAKLQMNKIEKKDELKKSDLKKYVGQRLGDKQEYLTLFGKRYEDLTNEIAFVEEQLKDENLEADKREETEGRLQQLKGKMQEMDQQVEDGIKLYVESDEEKSRNAKELKEKASQKMKKRKQQEIVRKRKEKATDRVIRLIKGYKRTTSDVMKADFELKGKELKQQIVDNFVYGKQVVSRAVKDMGHEFKEEWIDNDIRNMYELKNMVDEKIEKICTTKFVQRFLGNEKVKAVLQRAREAKNVVAQRANDMKREVRQVAKETTDSWKQTAVSAMQDRPQKRKDALHRLADGVVYAKQRAGDTIVSVGKKMAETKVLKPIVQDLKESKRQFDYSREDKKVYKRQERKRKVAHVKDIIGYAKDMKDKVFTNLRKMSPITINHDAKSVQAMERAANTLKVAGKRKMNETINSGKSAANELLHKIGDRIETKTMQKQEELQQIQAQIDQGKGERGDL